MKGLIKYDKQKAYDGYTLFAETGRVIPEKDDKGHPIYLINMKGEIVYQWAAKTSLQSYCKLLKNGNLIYPSHDRSDVDTGNVGLFELNPDNEIVWSYKCRTDHDFQVLDSGNILIHTINENIWPELGREMKRQPYIIEITKEKDLVWEWKGEEHLFELFDLLGPERSRFVKERIKGNFAFDWAHNNTTQVIGQNRIYEKNENTCFKPGNITFSYRSLDVIGVIDKDTKKIVWVWGPGIIDGQHKPHMLENGNILIFDNGTLRGYSRVIELDPITEKIVWEYTAERKEDFFSQYISGAQRLPNGNTFICEGGKARLFEVTPEKEIVWDFINPYTKRAKSDSIYRSLRYSPEYVRSLPICK